MNKIKRPRSLNALRSHGPKPWPTGLLLLITLLSLVQPACTKKDIRTIAVPAITAVSATTLHVGDTLVITGSNFSTKPDDNLVALSTAALKVVKASATQLSAVIPSGAQTGQLTVSLAAGKSVTWTEQIYVIGGTQPYITSVTPASAWAGDTVIVRGGNFGTPSSTNDIVVDGIACTIFNSTDSLIRMTIPGTARSGPLTVTTNGQTSPPVNFSVFKFNPLSDGRLYWVYAFNPCCETPTMQVFRGTDSANAFPYGTTQFTNPSIDELAGNYSIMLGSPIDPLIHDPQGNVYYLYNIYNNYSFSSEYQLIRLSPSGSTMTHTVLWDRDFADAGTSTYYPTPGNTTTSNQVPNTPAQLSIDGNTLYVKLGVSDMYYTADVSATSPVFTLQTGVLPDSASFGAQFGTSYVFYKLAGASSIYNGPDHISAVKYAQKGSTVSQTIPLPPDETIYTTLGDNSHGDNVLIITQTQDANPMMKIYKFSATTQALQLLYGPSNWTDALVQSSSVYIPYITGILWAGSHIYYADIRRSFFDPYNYTYSYAALYELSDDGTTTQVRNVYPRLEPATAASAATSLYLFNGKN